MGKYIPTKGEKFRAFSKAEFPGKEHIFSPFNCLGSDKFKVVGATKGGLEFNLSRHDFYFETLND